MSHVETVKVRIMDLQALKDACERLGVTFVEGKTNYVWYGHHVGDYPVPAGFTKDDLGKCQHVIRAPDTNYEIGVTPCPDGKGYTLLYDFWGPGKKLMDRFGKGLTKLVDTYSVEALKRKARAKGYLTRETTVDGKIHLTLTGLS